MCTARQQDKSFLTELTGSSVDPLHDRTGRGVVILADNAIKEEQLPIKVTD